MLLLSACAQTPTPTVPAVHFDLLADDSSAPLIKDLAAAYQAERPHVTIHIEQAANAQRALEALAMGGRDLATLSWLPESQKAAGALWGQPFARDALVIITHPRNPLGGLKLSQLRDIFQGQEIFWQALGGPEMEIIPVSREKGAGTRASFEALVMGGRDVTPTAVVLSNNEIVAAYVSRTPGAIGYISMGWLSPDINIMAIEGITPSPASIADGRYLLARPFYLAALQEPYGDLAMFVDWIQGDQGRGVIQRLYAPAP